MYKKNEVEINILLLIEEAFRIWQHSQLWTIAIHHPNARVNNEPTFLFEQTVDF